MNKIRHRLKPSHYIILFFIPAITFVNLNHHKWNGKEGVIIWDIKSYYTYLPATFIYKDLSLEYIFKYPEKNLNQKIWRIKSPTGKRAIITTSGLAMMYAPFFFISHAYAGIDHRYEADGYSKPYHVGLVFSALFYFILSLLVLRKILLKYVNEKITSITLFTIGAGTNLFHYLTYEAPMPHSYNFFLTSLFILLVIKRYENPNLKNTIFLGLVSGLFVLIRPTNIIMLLLIPLYGVISFKTFKESIIELIKNWHLLLIMMVSFVIVWIPQFVYWHYVTGKIFYFSYGDAGGKFFFENPQIIDFLFSFKKGWYVYTPIMLMASIGLYRLYLLKNKFSIAIPIILILYIYVLSSWWCWWYGGSFGQRSMIDIYSLMAIPLAVFFAKKRKYLVTHVSIAILTVLFIFYNQFQILQYRKGSIHFWWMSKEMYMESFMKLRPSCKFKKILLVPDYNKALQGIYTFKPGTGNSGEISDSMLMITIIEDLKNERKEKAFEEKEEKHELYAIQAKKIIENRLAENVYVKLKIKYYKDYIHNCMSWRKEIEDQAKKDNIPYEKALLMEANRIYDIYSEKYEDRFK